MELREWATEILSADTLEKKLFAPDVLTDLHPGEPLIWKEPVRPPGMDFKRWLREENLPSFKEHHNADKRAVCLHRFAGHELLAVEIMAFALLAFPDAPANFRKGLAHTLKEEQEHVRIYCKRMEGLGLKFGDLPLYKHFWSHTRHISSPLHYVSMMSLTFEQANLDFAPQYGRSFLQHGDQASADLMATILKDEISHVRFGLQWLKRMKQEYLPEWDAWEQTLASTLLVPKRAKGFILNGESRKQAGLSEEWITKLATL